MAEQTTLTLDSRVTQGERQVSTIVDGETVLMHVGNGKYYKVDDIGSRVWTLIETPTPVRTVCDQLLKEFNVERQVCETAVLTLLDKLLQSNLIQVIPDA